MTTLFLVLFAFVASVTSASSQTASQRNVDVCLSGRFPALCDHNRLTPEQLRQARAAEHRENLRVCMTGQYPALCDHSKLNSSEAAAVKESERVENLRVCSSGKYRTQCNHAILTYAQSRYVRAAEEEENLKNCLDGRFPALCQRDWLTTEQRAKAAAAETAVRARTNQISSVRPFTTGGGGCSSGHWIESVHSDGKVIKLEDGSLWEVSDIDTITSMLWLPISEVVVCGSKMINTDDDESVSVSPFCHEVPPCHLRLRREYIIQASANDETFVINGEVFKAKTHCGNFDRGDRVVFISGSPSGACSSAQILNLRTDRTCNVWCE